MSNPAEEFGKHGVNSDQDMRGDASLLFFLKWGDFVLEKVLQLIMQWEATVLGQFVLAFVLVASMAFSKVLLIPPGLSMWLTGMILGHVLGFVITMIGSTIGISLLFFIGTLFRDRGHKVAIDRRLGQQGSGRLMRTLADTKFDNHQVTVVEAVFNIIILFLDAAIGFIAISGMDTMVV
ncbi:uncharacterized protein LOC143890203 [Tasmannia lanceolata]|uniref:uncharacterized protein LOC143890203 n=1 Tax=Tasmannia lanceolata TaxID=3420 RepID=UPI00406312B7